MTIETFPGGYREVHITVARRGGGDGSSSWAGLGHGVFAGGSYPKGQFHPALEILEISDLPISF